MSDFALHLLIFIFPFSCSCTLMTYAMQKRGPIEHSNNVLFGMQPNNFVAYLFMPVGDVQLCHGY